MTAVWMRARAELRASKRSLVALAVLLGIFGSVAMAAAAGARRTESAYDRFVAATAPPDAVVFSGTKRGQRAFPVIPLHRVLRLPQVESGTFGPTLSGELLDAHGHVVVNDNNLSIYGLGAHGPAAPFARVKLLSGRMPAPTGPPEIAIGYNPAVDRRVPIGSVLRLALVRSNVNPALAVSFAVPPKDLLPPVSVRLVGVVLYQGEFTGSQDVFVTNSLRSYIRRSFGIPSLVVRLKRGAADYPAFSQAVENRTPGAALFSPSLTEGVVVNRATRLFAIALWAFGGLAALAGALVFGQALLRQIFIDSTENGGLSALGMTGDQLFTVAMIRTAAVALGGAAIAVLGAFLLSTFMPIGHLARLADPHPGFSFDWLVLMPGTAAVVVVTFAIAALPAYVAGRRRTLVIGLDEGARSRPSTVARALASGGFPPSAVAGARMALESGRGRTATPVRSALVGTAVSLAAIAAALTFGTSLGHLVDTPRLYGVGWQYQAGSAYGGAGIPAIQAVLARDEHIGPLAAADLLDTATVGPRGHAVQVDVFATQAVRGGVHPTVGDGRWPSSPSEIALGAKTLRAIGARVGSTISVRAGNRSTTMRVVGQAVFPEFGFNGPGLGSGAGLTLTGLARLIPSAHADGFGFDFKPGTNVPATIRELNQKLAKLGAGVQDAGGSSEISNLSKIQRLPLALAGLLALAALAAVANLLVTSIRRRRRDLAILMTLGFVRRQVWATVAWQASCVAVVSLAVGIPLGIATGRWTWNAFADNIGVVPEPVVPIAAALFVVPIAIAAANTLGALPARIASRMKAAAVLRSE